MINEYLGEALKTVGRKVHTDLTMIDIMREFGWTYDEYLNTPESIINLILLKSEADYKISKSKNGNK